jgi:hypothetical protein
VRRKIVEFPPNFYIRKSNPLLRHNSFLTIILNLLCRKIVIYSQMAHTIIVGRPSKISNYINLQKLKVKNEGYFK